MSSEDQRPWYRQFWCWFVIAPLGLWVIAMTGTVFVFYGNQTDLVVGDFSKVGKAYVQNRAASDRAAALGVTARVHIERDSGRVTLALEGLDNAPDRLKVLLVHPTIAKRDLGVELQRDETGLYRGATGGAIENRRYVIIRPIDGSWRLRGELKAQKGDLRLEPPGGGA